MAKCKKFSLSVGEFACPAPLSGSIDLLQGLAPGNLLGQEVHQRVQEKNAKNFPGYQKEVEIKHHFIFEQYSFHVRGRIDGLFPGEVPRLEEIKSTFALSNLAQKLKNPYEHPYGLQLLTYGYLYWLKHQVLPELTFHLVSLSNFRHQEHRLILDIPTYEGWLHRRLTDLALEIKASHKRRQRRRALAKKLIFPFAQGRSGQIELIQTIEAGMAQKQAMMIQAPTGLGKTMGVLFPTLGEALKRGQRVIYLTPKNGQHAVAEEACEKLAATARSLKALTITAKSKICLKDETLCNPDYCEYARDHYSKMEQHQVLQVLSKKRKLTARVFKKIAQDFLVCPFELQLDAAKEADVIICDYNYAFAPHTAFGRLASNPLGQEGKPNLVIDEAHNLPTRAMEYYSPALSTLPLEALREAFTHLPGILRPRGLHLLDSCLELIRKLKPKGPKQVRLDLSPEPFRQINTELREFLSLSLAQEERADPALLQLCFYWSEFTQALDYVQDEAFPHFFASFTQSGAEEKIKITCCDPSQMLALRYEDYEQVVAFSATLRPFDFYQKLTGLASRKLKVAEFSSPFPRSQRKLLIIPQVSSKFSERQRHYPRIAQIIEKIIALKQGNYLAFFPSFDFLQKVLAHLTLPPGFSLFTQHPGMKKTEVENILKELKQGERAYLGLAVQGGTFAEGIDYPGEMVIGAFVVGTALPTYSSEREGMKQYYQEQYGQGFDYAYTYPAMARAVQAAGRVIRSPTDRGLIVLMDQRFTELSFAQSMPQDWFELGPQELVPKSILKEVGEFWQT